MPHKNKLNPVEFLEFAHEHHSVISFDCETTGLDAFACKPILYTLSAGTGAGMHSISLEPSDMVHGFLKLVFTDPQLKIVMHNSSYDCKIVHRFICPFREIKATILDTIVLAWLCDNRGARKFGKPFGLKSLSQKYLGHKMTEIGEVFKTGPLALARLDLERRASKLAKGWRKMAKRHEARQRRNMARQHALARSLMKTDATMSRAEKAEANAALKQVYDEFAYDYTRAELAVKRRLAFLKRQHEALSVKIKRQFIDYALDDAAVTLRLFWLFRKKLIKLKLDKWARVEMYCRNFATDMEISGVGLDTELLHRLDEAFNPEIEAVRQECFRLAGAGAGQDKIEFNILAPREVSAILHNLLGVAPDPRYVQLEETSDSKENRKKNVTAAPWFKTNKRVLLYTKHPLAGKILEYRGLVKLQGTYTKKLRHVRGRLHAYFRSSGTDTGRFASSGPNLQNIPSRSKVGKKIREAFVPRAGFKLVVADLSQIELRTGATICNEPAMLETFNQYKMREDGTRDYTIGDIHAETQRGLALICPFDVTREHAKVCNFALTFGQSAISFALLYLIEFDVADSLRTAFFEKYQAINSMLYYLGDLWRRDKIRSWRIPFSGRMRHWDRYDYVYDPNTGEEYRTDTYASKGNILNTLVQGSAADVFKMALQAFWRWVVLHEDFKDAVFPIMQVHDEVVVEVREDLAVFVAKLLKYCMEYAWFDTPCPILADVHVVNRWSEGKNGKREALDETGKPKLDEKGKPLMEDVLPEMNKELKYLTPADIAACQQYIPQLPSIEIHKAFTVSHEELAGVV